MEFRPILSVDDPLYPPLVRWYQMSFPLHEQRTPAQQTAAFAHPDYRLWALMEEGTVVGALSMWEAPAFFYVEHFFLDPQARNRGWGSRALSLLQRQGKAVILEIDPPVVDIARRRQGFYLRNGFCANPYPHVHPPYRREFQGHSLVVLSAPAPLSQEAYSDFYQYICHTVMTGCPG